MSDRADRPGQGRDTDPEEVALDTEERAALEALPRAVEPDALLEERTVRALRARGLLRGAGAVRRRAWSGWAVAAAAAGATLFAGGYALGQARGGAAALELVSAVRDADAAERATLVQQAGSAYVTAVASLAELQGQPGAAAETLREGSEAARAALRGAAGELARLYPEDARLLRVLDILIESPRAADGDVPARTVVWY